MRNPKVTLIVPFYNVEKYIRKCLESIASQTYKNIDVIIVNDGAKDNSRSIVLEFIKSDPRFRLFDKENGGLSSGRNYGLKIATGEFICFVDSDDYLAPDYVENLLNGFDESTDVVIGDYAICDVNNNRVFSHRFPLQDKVYITQKEKEDLLRDLLIIKRPVMSVWKNMYRKELLDKLNIAFESERIVYAEDELFHVSVYIEARKVHVINKIVYYHVYVSNSLSQGYRKNLFEMLCELSNRITSILNSYGYTKLAEDFSDARGSIVGSALLNACKCDYRNAYRNVKDLLSKKQFVDLLNKNKEDIKLPRYRAFFILAKTRNSLLITTAVKTMLSCNSLYRYMNRKRNT